jgi:hypothetical protein
MKLKYIRIIILMLIVLVCFAFKFGPDFLAKSYITLSKEQLRSGIYDEEFQYHQFSDKSHITFCVEHGCCSGNGYYDAVVIRTSEGTEYESRNNYCGYEGFWHEVVHASSNLEDLDSLLMSTGYTKN